MKALTLSFQFPSGMASNRVVTPSAKFCCSTRKQRTSPVVRRSQSGSERVSFRWSCVKSFPSAKDLLCCQVQLWERWGFDAVISPELTNLVLTLN